MASVFDVAKYILHEKGRVSTWKLQKLCYYSQAWHMAWTEHPLFDERFEAWANGPVCPALFYDHQGSFQISEDELQRGDIEGLTDDEKDSINIVLNGYGDKEPYDLREMTHSEDPWKKARGELPEGASSQNIITLESMAEYYGSL